MSMLKKKTVSTSLIEKTFSDFYKSIKKTLRLFYEEGLQASIPKGLRPLVTLVSSMDKKIFMFFFGNKTLLPYFGKKKHL